MFLYPDSNCRFWNFTKSADRDFQSVRGLSPPVRNYTDPRDTCEFLHNFKKSSFYKSFGLRFLNFLGSIIFAESCAFVSRDLAQVNSRAKINRPAITGGRVNGPGRINRTPPIAMSVKPKTETMVLRRALGN